MKKEVNTMKYATPELVIVGEASVLIQGIPGGSLDNDVSETSHAVDGLALGLDD
jgi:hypothetical protein